MNSKIVAAFILAGVFSAPVFADGDVHYPDQQSQAVAATSQVTRAQVKQELTALRKAGYSQTGEDNTYPTEIQAAEARVHNVQAQPAFASGDAGASKHPFASVKARILAAKLHRPAGSLDGDAPGSVYFGS